MTIMATGLACISGYFGLLDLVTAGDVGENFYIILPALIFDLVTLFPLVTCVAELIILYSLEYLIEEAVAWRNSLKEPEIGSSRQPNGKTISLQFH